MKTEPMRTNTEPMPIAPTPRKRVHLPIFRPLPKPRPRAACIVMPVVPS